MAIEKQIWLQDILDNLYSGWEFLTNSKDHAQYVENNKVNVPQSGSAPAVVKNRSSLPADITLRTDTVLQYTIDSYTTDPIVITDYEELQTSYDKRMSVMNDHINVLNDTLAINILWNWATTTATSIFRTTGENGDDNLPHDTATGTRKRLTLKDVKRVAKLFDKQNVPQAGRFLLLPSEMYYDLFTIDGLLRKDYMDKTALPSGTINTVLGFNVINRGSGVLFNDESPVAKKAIDAELAADDNACAVAWHKDFVSRANSTPKVYINEDQATAYGTIISAQMFFGGRILRANDVGVAVIVQAAGVEIIP